MDWLIGRLSKLEDVSLSVQDSLVMLALRLLLEHVRSLEQQVMMLRASKVGGVMGYAADARRMSPSAAVDRCVLVLQRDGNVRIEGSAYILHAVHRAMIEDNVHMAEAPAENASVTIKV